MGAAAVAKDKTKSIKDLSIYRWLSSDLFIFVLEFHPRINVAFPFCCDVAVLAHVRADADATGRYFVIWTGFPATRMHTQTEPG